MTPLTLRLFKLVLNVLLLTGSCRADLTEDQLAHLRRERSEAAQKWAPLIYLHPNERFFPSAVHTFLQNVVPRKLSESERPTEPPVLVPMSRSLDTRALPEGVDGEFTYLFAPIDIKCKNCPLADFLYGTKPSAEYSPPVYATITSCIHGNKPLRNPRNIKPPSRQSNHRRFRLRKRLGRFSLRGRRKSSTPVGRTSRTSRTTTPYSDSYSSVPSPSPFTPPRGSYDPNHFDSLKKDSQNFIEDKSDLSVDLTSPLISPPSTTLLPPRTRSFTESTLQYLGVSTSPWGKTDYPQPVTTGGETVLPDSDGTTVEEGLTSSPAGVGGDSSTPVELDLQSSASIATQSTSSTAHLNSIRSEDKDDLKGQSFTVTYWMFYPFSQGKEVCTSRLWILGRVFKPRIRNKCYGEPITLNSHVGDWEHVSIYFEGKFPQLMYVSTHEYGAFYRYNPIDKLFVYVGKDTRMGLPLSPKYPAVIKMDRTHPVLYSALGSHGLWGSPGIHRYESLLPLEDKTGGGTSWKTWKNIDVIDYRDPEFDRPDRQWIHFHGRWGNPSSRCHKGLFGSCDLASGPTGIPLKRENFPCHIPQHPTFFPKD